MSAPQFTAEQLDAVDIGRRDQDACVVAGPGSGKTTVLVEYFRRLVEAGVDPLRILAITFTEKAAANMRRKLGLAFQDDAEKRARLERAWVSTVHGFCHRLLKENAVFAGIDPEFTIADERTSWRLQQESLKAAIDALLSEKLEAMRRLIRGLSSYEFERALLNAYDTMRCAGVGVHLLAAFPAPPAVTLDEIEETFDALRREDLGSTWRYDQKQQFESALDGAERIVAADTTLEALQAVKNFSCDRNKCKKGNNAYKLLSRMKNQIEESVYTLISEHYAPERELLLEILRRFDATYRARKRAAALLDFSDLEEFTVRLLEQNPDVQARVRRQFDHVLMDEFQDTNAQQAKLINLLRPPDRFYAVGDINQSIYGFRHADPSGFARYRDEIHERGRHLVDLTGNFRSRADILRAVERITNMLAGIEARPLVARREFEDAAECSVEAIAAPDPRAEAQWVARRIVEMTSGFAYGDFAVLVRNTEVIGEFTAAFDAAGIPYVVNRGKGFYESREVNDLTHLLRVIANPRDEISLAVVLRSPLVGASDEDLLRLKPAGQNLGAALMQCEDGGALAGFRDRLREWRARREYITFDRLLLDAIDGSGYEAAPNVDKFLAQAREAAPRMSLDEFIEELELVRADNPREPDAPPEDSSNTVKVMTVHSAKGLEFPVVFVAAMHKGVDSGTPDIAFSQHIGLGARWHNPATGEDASDLYLHAVGEAWRQREKEEANRLLYVAMTRAEQHLVLSFTLMGRRRPAQWDKTVIDTLLLDTSQPCAWQLRDMGGWKLRVLVADGPPELAAAPPADARESVVEWLARPLVTGQQDTNATVTALGQFGNCPREYYLARYLGYAGRQRRAEFDEPEDDRDLSAGEFGTQVHALLAGEPVAKPDPEAMRLAGVFRQSALGRRAEKAARIEREFDFLMALDDLVIRGQIDLWFEEAGEIVLVDYKTDDVTAAEARERAGDYAMQLRLYAMALERAAGRAPSSAWLHFLRPDAAIEVDLRPSLIENPEQLVRDFQEAQSKLDFPLNEGPRCRRCAFYRDLCPAGLATSADEATAPSRPRLADTLECQPPQ